MRTLDRLNVQGAKIQQIRPKLFLTEKETLPPVHVDLINRFERNQLSLQDRIGIYHNPDHISLACKDVRDTMRVYLGEGMKYNTTCVDATPVDPMSLLGFDTQRKGGTIGTYDFSQRSDPLYSTYQ